VNAILAEPNIKTRLIELGGAPLIQTPEQFGNDIAAETEKWRKVIEGAVIPKVE
jgi:tripartite-type tricarboxylate transporter receptor subunit TctC